MSFKYKKHKENLGCFETLLDDLQHHYSPLGLTETWLGDNDCVLFDVEGYNMVEKSRQNRSGEGVAICIKASMECSSQVQ